jgi:hypothetical protein
MPMVDQAFLTWKTTNAALFLVFSVGLQQKDFDHQIEEWKCPPR